MTRSLITLEEVVYLVEFAFENAKSGDIMVQKSGSALVTDLARAFFNF
jgi:UDP-N-acetylglucosamine 4,6-dehydratase